MVGYMTTALTPRRDSNGNWSYVDKDRNTGCLNIAGQYVIIPEYNIIAAWSDGRAAFRKSGNPKIGFPDLKGAEIIPTIFEDSEDFENDYVKVVQTGKDGNIDSAGK